MSLKLNPMASLGYHVMCSYFAEVYSWHLGSIIKQCCVIFSLKPLSNLLKSAWTYFPSASVLMELSPDFNAIIIRFSTNAITPQFSTNIHTVITHFTQIGLHRVRGEDRLREIERNWLNLNSQFAKAALGFPYTPWFVERDKAAHSERNWCFRDESSVDENVRIYTMITTICWFTSCCSLEYDNPPGLLASR